MFKGRLYYSLRGKIVKGSGGYLLWTLEFAEAIEVVQNRPLNFKSVEKRKTGAANENMQLRLHAFQFQSIPE